MASSSTVSLVAIAVALMAAFLQPGASSPPEAPATGVPTSCAGTLYSLFPCLPFLSLGTSLAGPPATCCSPLRSILLSPESICLCHVIGSEVNELAGTNIDPIRLALLPFVCLAIVPPQLPAMCFVGPVPPISNIPPSSPAAPALPPPPHH